MVTCKSWNGCHIRTLRTRTITSDESMCKGIGIAPPADTKHSIEMALIHKEVGLHRRTCVSATRLPV